MLFPDLHIYAKIILIFLGFIVLFPWITIPAIAMYQFFRLMNMPKVNVVGAKLGMDSVADKLGFTMADGGEPTDKKK